MVFLESVYSSLQAVISIANVRWTSLIASVKSCVCDNCFRKQLKLLNTVGM
jgi:hypothetical protein